MNLTPSNPKTCRRHGVRQTGFNARKREGAFTLTELLLAVGLVVLLVGAIVFSFSNLFRGAQLEEGTTRVEGLLRYARAQAANTGRRVQLVFDPAVSTNTPVSSNSGVRITWEPDPLGQPGRFEDFPQASWQVQDIGDLVDIKGVQLVSHCGKKSAQREMDRNNPDDGLAEEDPSENFAPITFYPDGSCESAEIVLASRTPEAGLRMTVNLAGITGSISHRLVTTNDYEGIVESEADTPQMPASRSAPEAP